MFEPDSDKGCPSCSYMADGFNGLNIYLNQRDINLVAISRGPINKLESYKKRMGRIFIWVSSLNNDFNDDFEVTISPNSQKEYQTYNYRIFVDEKPPMYGEAPGVSVFIKDENGVGARNVIRSISLYGYNT